MSSRRSALEYADVALLARALVASHAERCVWVGNWPHVGRAAPPADAEMLDRLLRWADDGPTRRRILVDNPVALYGFAPSARLPI